MWSPNNVSLPGIKRALKRRALKRRAPMGRYTHTLNIRIHIDLARGTYSSVHLLVSACFVPSDKDSWGIRSDDRINAALFVLKILYLRFQGLDFERNISKS